MLFKIQTGHKFATVDSILTRQPDQKITMESNNKNINSSSEKYVGRSEMDKPCITYNDEHSQQLSFNYGDVKQTK